MGKKAKKPRRNPWDSDYAPYGMADHKGSPDEWRAAYEHRMLGHDEAVAVLDKENPYTILGLAQGASKDDVKKAYRRLVMTQCKDAFSLTPDPAQVELFKKYHAAYSLVG